MDLILGARLKMRFADLSHWQNATLVEKPLSFARTSLHPPSHLAGCVPKLHPFARRLHKQLIYAGLSINFLTEVDLGLNYVTDENQNFS